VEGENWVWKGSSFLPPDYRLAMITLSRGGGDASVRREFDTATGAFVEDGFFVPEAKARVAWKDENTLWIGTDFGEGSMTTSGYPRFVKEWKRGTALEDAKTIFEGDVEDVSAMGYSDFTPERRYDLVVKTPAFFKGTYYINTGDELVALDIPEDANMYGFFKEHMLVNLRSDWEVGGNTYPSDALLAIDFDSFMEGDRSFDILFEPAERVAFGSLTTTADHLVYSTLDNVNGKLYRVTPGDSGWKKEEIPLPGLGTVGIGSSSEADNRFFFTYTDFVTPPSLYLTDAGAEPKQVKTTPEWYDATGVTVAQHEATSKDGTKIPYFVVMPAGFEADGSNPTLLYGYGGFEISMRPNYSGTTGSSWIERGGVYALANIRGGGEFGPKWHEAAIQENHQRNFDDFIAVAEDLIARNITSPAHLGIAGGSQGGLLVGGTFTQRPELFGAVVCQVPLLDMKRYNKLLAGASWMAEYGNPDTEDWDNYMQYWSPYQNLDADTDYPRVFFTTSTRDDRVHPGHARKMVAKMLDMDKPVYYYENTEGGHSAAANLNQRAYMWALTYSYLWKMLGEGSQSR
jgi:prolyl oligopeptidase